MEHRARKKNPFRSLLILFILLGASFFGAKMYWDYLKSPLDSQGKVHAFVIPRGQAVARVADRLESEKIIRSSLAFKIEYKLSKQPRIEAGDFKLSSSMNVKEVINTLSEGSIDKWVTIVEGLRVEEIARVLEKELGISKEEFLKVAQEGYMFPDTYLFNPQASAFDIASLMKNTFNNKYDAEIKAKIRAKGLTDEDGVILASIVEREARSDEVRTKVASILLKRINIGMKIDADATVQYAKDSNALKNSESLDKFWKPIVREDYKAVISPYNTYLNPGLPPSPICNPSLSSLQAVANADPSIPYLFYYHDVQGNSYYGRTLDEHNINVSKHR